MIKNDKNGLTLCSKARASGQSASQGAQTRKRCALKSILDSSFKYTHSSATDVRKTFARARLEQQAFDQAVTDWELMRYFERI